MSKKILDVQGVNKSFGGLKALNEVAIGRKAFDADTLARAEKHIIGMKAQIEGLTDRELEVLAHAGSGKTNKEIGKLLFISDRTVQGHLKNIYQKFGVTTRTEAVTMGLQHGFITLEGTNES